MLLTDLCLCLSWMSFSSEPANMWQIRRSTFYLRLREAKNPCGLTLIANKNCDYKLGLCSVDTILNYFGS